MNLQRRPTYRWERVSPASQIAIRAGFEDASAGRGFRPEYERWPPRVQLNYEAGRFGALKLQLQGKSPWWLPHVQKAQRVAISI